MRTQVMLLSLATLPLFTGVICAAETGSTSPSQDKNNEYSITNPKPKEQMRAMSTDRPALTDKPYTVDAGHYQVEVEAFSLTRDSSGNRTAKTLSTEINFKMGLCNRSDVQFVLEPYRSVEITGGGTNFDESGIGDLDIRYKYNIWGNDGGESAAAIMPFITLPIHSDQLDANREVTGGIIFPFSAKIEKEWTLGVMLEIDVVRNVADDGYVAQFIQSLSVGHQIIGNLDGYVEIFNLASADDRASGKAFFGAGAMFAFGPDIMFDAGLNIGLTEAAEDIRAMAGISVRH